MADDDTDILNIIRMILQTRGYSVVTSKNADELFSYAQCDLPELILIDIWMAGADGRDICSRLKKERLTSKIPIIFISANSHIATIAKDYLADGFIAKPFEMNFLLQTVKEHLCAS